MILRNKAKSGRGGGLGLRTADFGLRIEGRMAPMANEAVCKTKPICRKQAGDRRLEALREWQRQTKPISRERSPSGEQVSRRTKPICPAGQMVCMAHPTRLRNKANWGPCDCGLGIAECRLKDGERMAGRVKQSQYRWLS